MVFSHEYDFGTTTDLNLKVIETRKRDITNIEIASRNNLPEFKCKCGSIATRICVYYGCNDNGLLCSNCATTHECGEESQMPIVNSPRMGMCGYTGG